MTNKFLFWQSVLRDKLHMFKQRYLNGIPTMSETYGTDTGEIRDDRSGARVAREWLKYAAVLVLIFTLGIGNAWGTERSFTFTPTSKTAGTTSGDVPSGVSCTYNNSYAKNQCTKNNSFSFSTSGMSSITINSVVVSLSKSSNGVGTTNIKIGSNTLGSRTSYDKSTSSGTEYTYNNSSSYSGEVSVSCSVTTSSIYFWSVTIYYEESTETCSTNPSVGGSSNSSFFLYVSNLNINNFKDHFSLLF